MGSRLEKNSAQVRKRIQNHKFVDEDGEEYSASGFGEFSNYLRRKKIKLQNRDVAIREQNEGLPKIFKNIVAYVNGYTQPGLNDLHQMIVAHGGGFMQYLDGKTSVTHIIASQLTPKKKVEFKRYRVVKPAWVVDSIAAGKMLSWDHYRLYDESAAQKTLAFGATGLTMQQAMEQSSSYMTESNTGWYAEQLRNAIHSDIAHGPIEDVIPILNAGDPDPHIDPEMGALRSALAISQSDAVSFNRAARPEGATPIFNSQSAATTTEEMLSDDNNDNDDDDDDHDGAAAADPVRLDQLKLPGNLYQTIGLVRPDNDELPVPNVILTPSASSQTPNSPSTPEDAPSPLPIAPIMASVQSVEADQQLHVTDSVTSPNNSEVHKRALTAEEHNTVLLQDPHLAKSSTANPDFIDQYYRESRLHHLSTWKAQLKATLMARGMNINPQRKSSSFKTGRRRYVLHVDFDSFFVAVSLRQHPNLRDSPVAIAHGTGHGSEIASCNYPARQHGVKNGMWMVKARELCSNLKVLPYDFPAYEEASRQFYETILALDAVVQSISVDEALVDVSELCIRAGGTDGCQNTENAVDREERKAFELAQAIRDGVHDKTGCEVSVGIAANILLAKIACRAAKPAGQFHLSPAHVLDHIGALAVQDLPGIGWSWQNKLEALNIKVVKDIREASKELLIAHLGPKTGQKLWEYSRGIDHQQVGEQTQRKSVSCEINWGIRFRDQNEAEVFMGKLCVELSRRLLDNMSKGRAITLKIMRRAADADMDPPKNLGHGKCDTINKSVLLGRATADAALITTQAISMLRALAYPPGELRGVGVQITRLEPISAAYFQGDRALQDGSQRKLLFTRSVAQESVPQKRDLDALASGREQSNDSEALGATNNLAIPPPHRASHDGSASTSLDSAHQTVPARIDTSVPAEAPKDLRLRVLSTTVGGPSDLNGMNKKADVVPRINAQGEQNHRDRSNLQHRRRGKQQQLLPQSPRKPRQLPPGWLMSVQNDLQQPDSEPRSLEMPDIAVQRNMISNSAFQTSKWAPTASPRSSPILSDIPASEEELTLDDEDVEASVIYSDVRYDLTDYSSSGCESGSDVLPSEAVSECGDMQSGYYDFCFRSGSSDTESNPQEEVEELFELYLEWQEGHEELLRIQEEEEEERRRQEEQARQERAARGEPEPEAKSNPSDAEAEQSQATPKVKEEEDAHQGNPMHVKRPPSPVRVPLGPPKPTHILPRAKLGEDQLSNTRDVCDYLCGWLRSCLSMDALDPDKYDVGELSDYLELVVLEEHNLYKVQTILESIAFACSQSFVYPSREKRDVFKKVWLRWTKEAQAVVKSQGYPPLSFGVTF